MNINLLIPAVLPVESIIKRITTLEFPAVIVDDEMKIMAKNKSASSVFSNLRSGRTFKKHVCAEDVSDIENMQEKQIMHINLADGKNKAVVICGNGYRLFVVTKAFAHAHDGVLRLYRESSGYDINLVQPNGTKMGFANKENVDETTEKISCCDVLSSLNTVFDAADVFARFCSEMKSKSGKFKKQFEIAFHKETMAILGAEKDFSLILAYLTRFCLEKTVGTSPKIKLFRSEDEVVLQIKAELDTKEYPGNLKNGFDTEEKYWFYLIKLLADGNLWDFSEKHLPNGQTEFLLKAKHVAIKEKYVLRDISNEYIRRIIDFVFADKFD